MNKIITLGISLLLILSAAHAQKIDYDNSSKWFLGFNVGGTWHTSDVKNDLNGGWGITLGKSFNYNYGKRLSFDIRARYLGGRWYGQDYSLSTFDSLSYFQQEYKPLAPYADSSSFSLVNNFQTELHSLSLELVLHANGIRERSGWDPYIFGGIGVKWYQTYGDLLNQESLGELYDYSSLGSDINSTTISGLNDGIFDSALEGSEQDKFSVAIMPSLGIGLGYQVGKRVTLGLEHKTTFTRADVFDGLTSSVGKFKQDLYHYSSLYVQFRFRTNSKGSSNNVNNIENYNTNQNNVTNCNTPTINFRSPQTTASVSNNQIFNLVADVYNVTIRENIQLLVNGVASTNFTFNASTGRLESAIVLNQGANTIEINATNNCGPTSSMVSMSYEPCLAPVITLINPTAVNSSTTNAAFTFSASVANFNGTQGISVTQNGKAIPNVSFNGNTISANVTLESGVNTFIITANTSCGADSESFTVNYSPCLLPVINLVSPATNNLTVATSTYTLNATILNVSNAQSLKLTQNGKVLTGSTFTGGSLRRNVTLSAGTNTFVITATNTCGTVSETITINYNDCVPPTISWTSPSVNNSTVANASYSVVAQIANVSSASGVVLTQNGQVLSGSTYTGGTLRRNVTLVSGVNTFVITATNACGTVSETITINYNDCVPPTISWTSPSVNNSTVANASYSVVAQIGNVSNSSGVVLTQNGQVLSGSTYIGGTLRRNVTLVSGVNTFVITATNACGTVSETITINYNDCVPPTISWTSPSVNNSTVANASYSVVAQIANVSNASGVVLTQNGQVLSGSTYTGGTLRRSVTLVSGVNTFVITATNACGTVSETITINYNDCVPPTISWTSPSVNNSTVANASYSVVAQIANVSNASGVVLTQNGQVLSGSTYTGGTLRRNVTLVSGVNTFVITATNACGTVSETITINYNDCVPPTISWTSPSVNNSTVANASYSVVAQIANVSSASGVVLTQNGQVLSGSTYTGGTLRRSVTLVSGVNTFVITATNACGTVSETITINYNDCVPPTISWTSPSVNNSTVTNAISALLAQIGNVTDASGVVLTQNGQTVSGVTYSAGMLRKTVTLVSGVNTFVITATNACGTVSETITINYNDCVPPMVTGLSPVQNNANVNNPNLTFSVQMQHITNGQTIVLTQNGSPLTNFNFSNGTLTVSVTLIQGANVFTLTAPNACGVINETLTINYKPLETEEPNGSGSEEVITICVALAGGRVKQTKQIPLSQWPFYQAQGATLGACPEEPSGQGGNGLNGQGGVGGNKPNQNENNGNQEQKITICHYPPGNNGNAQTIEIPLSAWPAHQAHGDVLGPCPQEPDNNGNNGQGNQGGNNSNGNSGNNQQNEGGSNSESGNEGTSNGSGLGGVGNVGGNGNGGRSNEGEGDKKPVTNKPTTQVKPKPQPTKPKPTTPEPKQEEPKEGEGTEKEGDLKPLPQPSSTPKGRG